MVNKASSKNPEVLFHFIGVYLVPGAKWHTAQRKCYPQCLTKAIAIFTQSAYVVQVANILVPIHWHVGLKMRCGEAHC